MAVLLSLLACKVNSASQLVVHGWKWTVTDNAAERSADLTSATGIVMIEAQDMRLRIVAVPWPVPKVGRRDRGG
jgi:hypothetical protein